MKTNLYKEMLDNLYEGIYFVDRNRKITFWNKAAERITGFKANEVVRFKCYNNILNHINDEGKCLCLEGCPLHETIADGKSRETAVYLHHKDGHRVAVTVRTLPIYEEGEIVGAVEMFKDDRETHALYRELENLKILANIDQLTELPNRRYVDVYMKSKLQEFLNLGIPFGIMFIDIDHFKAVNDTYGHDIGDEILKMVAKVFDSAVRKNDLIGRWGGEEFVGVFQGCDSNELETVAEKIRILNEASSLRHASEEIKVTVSIGATMVRPEDTLDGIIDRADKLMYESKINGRNRVTMEQ